MGLLLLKIAIKMAAELQNIARDKKTIELGWPPIAQYCARGENIEESTIQAKNRNDVEYSFVFTNIKQKESHSY